MKMIANFYDRLLGAMGGLAAILLGLATLIITTEILIRGMNLGSLPWAVEVVEYSLLCVTFLAAPWILRKAAHVRVDIVVENMRPGVQRVFDLLANLTGIVVCAILFYYGLKSTIGLAESGTRIFKVLTVKEWWLFSLLPLSCAFLIVEFIRRIWLGRRANDVEEPPGGEAGF